MAHWMSISGLESALFFSDMGLAATATAWTFACTKRLYTPGTHSLFDIRLDIKTRGLEGLRRADE